MNIDFNKIPVKKVAWSVRIWNGLLEGNWMERSLGELYDKAYNDKSELLKLKNIGEVSISEIIMIIEAVKKGEIVIEIPEDRSNRDEKITQIRVRTELPPCSKCNGKGFTKNPVYEYVIRKIKEFAEEKENKDQYGEDMPHEVKMNWLKRHGLPDFPLSRIGCQECMGKSTVKDKWISREDFIKELKIEIKKDLRD